MTLLRIGFSGLFVVAMGVGCGRSHGPGSTGGTGGSAGGRSGAGGNAGSGADDGGTGGVGGVVGDFRSAWWAAYCKGLYECVVEGEGAEALRVALGSQAHCRKVFEQSVAANFGLRDLAEAVSAGRVIFASEAVSACLDGTASCDYWANPQPADRACRRVYEGTQAEGEACYRDEECTGDGRCLATDVCPGTCGPRAAAGEECASADDCDDSNGPVACRFTCDPYTVRPAVGEGEECWDFLSEDADKQPCAIGLWCQGDGIFPLPAPEVGSEMRRGTCRGSPLAAGDACDDDADICESGYACWDGTCQFLGIVDEPGQPCGDASFCNPFERLECVEGSCESIGDGGEGTPCKFHDWSAHASCDPGLTCVIAGDDDPVLSSTPRECLPLRAVGEACAYSHECLSETCGADRRCAARFCANAKVQY